MQNCQFVNSFSQLHNDAHRNYHKSTERHQLYQECMYFDDIVMYYHLNGHRRQ